MTATHIIIIFSFLSLIVFALGIYLGMLLMKLKMQKKQFEQMKKVAKLAVEEKNKFFEDSIITIAKATLQKQCELSEACIRIKKLLERFPDIESHPELQTIQQMYLELEEFDYLEDRQALTKQERYSQDKKRFAVEDKFALEMDKSLNLLVELFSTKH